MDTSDIIATCSTVIAICAVSATIWQGILTRTHNRLSVRPHLARSENREFENDSATISYTVRNVGAGPALISERYFLYKGKRFVPADTHIHLVQAMVRELLGTKHPHALRHFGLPGAVLASGDEQVIARIVFPKCSPEQLNALLKSLPEFRLCIHYSSIYQEEFELKD